MRFLFLVILGTSIGRTQAKNGINDFVTDMMGKWNSKGNQKPSVIVNDILKKVSDKVGANLENEVGKLLEDSQKVAKDLFTKVDNWKQSKKVELDGDIVSTVNKFDLIDKSSIVRDKLMEIAKHCRIQNDTKKCVEHEIESALTLLAEINFMNINITKEIIRWKKIVKKFLKMVLDMIESLNADEVKECLTDMLPEKAERVMKERIHQWVAACSHLEGEGKDAEKQAVSFNADLSNWGVKPTGLDGIRDMSKCREYVQELFMKQCGSKEADFFRLFSASTNIKNLLNGLITTEFCTDAKSCLKAVSEHYGFHTGEWSEKDSGEWGEKMYSNAIEDLQDDNMLESLEECVNQKNKDTCMDEIAQDNADGKVDKKKIKHRLVKKSSEHAEDMLRLCLKKNETTKDECKIQVKEWMKKIGIDYKSDRVNKVARGRRMFKTYLSCIESQGCENRKMMKEICRKHVINASLADGTIDTIDEAYDTFIAAEYRENFEKQFAKRCPEDKEELSTDGQKRKEQDSIQEGVDTLISTNCDLSSKESRAECWKEAKEIFEKNNEDDSNENATAGRKWDSLKTKAAAALALDRSHDECYNKSQASFSGELRRACNILRIKICKEILQDDSADADCWLFIKRMKIRRKIRRCLVDTSKNSKSDCANLITQEASEAIIGLTAEEDSDFLDIYNNYEKALNPGKDKRILAKFTLRNCDSQDKTNAEEFETLIATMKQKSSTAAKCKKIRYSSNDCNVICEKKLQSDAKQEDIDNELNRLNEVNKNTITALPENGNIRGNSRILSGGSNFAEAEFSQGQNDNVDDVTNNVPENIGTKLVTSHTLLIVIAGLFVFQQL